MKHSTTNGQMCQWCFVVLIALPLVAFAILSYTAVLTKSSTYDEPMHAVAGATHRQQRDFRMNIEDPPLWLYWAELPNWNHPLSLDLSGRAWKEMLNHGRTEWKFAVDTLYHTPGTDGEAYIRRCRPMQILLGVALGCTLALFTWQIAGRWAALIAVLLFAFDPGFLAHAALIKNDVAITLVILLLVWTIWQIGRRASGWTIATAILLSALSLTVKFSGVLLIPVVILLLTARALLPLEWQVLGRNLTTRASRLSFSLVLIVTMAVAAYVGVWASYGFRFLASVDGERIDTKNIVVDAASVRTGFDSLPADSQPQIREPEANHAGDDWSTRLTDTALQYHVLPEAWLDGLLFVNEWAKARPAYLCGQRSATGWWYYFPLAVVFKAPLATLLLAAVLAAGYVVALVFYARDARSFLSVSGLWTVIALVVPVACYGLFAVTSHLNIGIRHVLPLYPFAFMAIGIGFAGLISRWRRLGQLLYVIVVAGLIVETATAWPNYLAFFNAACGGPRGGLQLLADSNLDWGQDLPLLQRWQHEHPTNRLYLSYPQTVDPAAYEIQFAGLPGNSVFAKPTVVTNGPACFAISATVLQRVYFRPEIFDELLTIEPTDVLGGTIYIWQENGTVLNLLGICFMNSNQFAAATEVLERAVQLQPSDAALHSNLGSALAQVGKLPQAIEHMRQSAKLDPSREDTHIALGSMLASAGAVSDAVAEFELAIQLRPNRADIHVNLADLLSGNGEPAKAIDHYQRALRLQPDLLHAYANLAKALAAVGRSQEAIATAQQGISAARSGNQTAEARKIEEWLKHYQTDSKRPSSDDRKSPTAPATQ